MRRRDTKAKSLLQEHFGNPMKIAAAYMGKIFTWPIIKSEDVRALQAYSIFLRQCNNAMRGINFSMELDTPSNMQTVVKKLPYKLKERWREAACNLKTDQIAELPFMTSLSSLRDKLKSQVTHCLEI